MATVDVSRIGSNIGALNSLSALTTINNQLAVHQTRLSTGKRINTASDDPAGLTIATKLNSRSEGLKVALNNIGDAKNLLAVAESGLGRINDILVQMRNKAEAAASDTMGKQERSAIVTQLKAYAAQIDDITAQTEWNGTTLIDGSYSTTSANLLTFQTGAGKNDKTTVGGLEDMSATGAGSLEIADINTSSSVNILNSSAQFTSITAVAKANDNLSLLKSGKYTIEVTQNGTGAADEVHLYDQNGNEMLISQTPASGVGAVNKGLSFDSTAGPTTVNFGNGLQFVLADGADADATWTAEVEFQADGDYSLKFDDGVDDPTDPADSPITLTENSKAAHFNRYMAFLESKMNVVSGQLSNIGALSGRLGFKEEQITASQINTEAAYNRIMNANMAEEQVNASKLQILQQTSTAMLAQANAAPQFLLSLFR